MADHAELVSELATIEKMSNQERLKHARKRRVQQLKKWSQHEKEYNSKRKKTEHNLSRTKPRKNDYKVHFVPSVMLLEAAARNDIEEVRRLLMLGVSPDSTNEDGLTALHQCCIDDSEEMMKLLLEFGANVNAKDSEQWTPLHAAATCGHIHLVQYLINKDADLLAVNADGNMSYDICEDETTLDFIEYEMAKRGITQEMIDDTRAAIELNMLSFIKVLHEEGEDLEYRDHQGATPLHIAAANGYVSVVEFLLDHNVSTDVSDNDLWQPIHAAACWGHPQVIELLVQAGADLSAKTKNGETPYDISEDPELKERIVQLKNEMETKRASQPQKLRRSHSQNTRSQSVRRTSIREKIQISRREAQEEARIRRENQYESQGDEDDEAKQRHDKSEKAVAAAEEEKTPLIVDTIQRMKGKQEEQQLTSEELPKVSNKELVLPTEDKELPQQETTLAVGPSPEKLDVVAGGFQEDGTTPKVPGDSVTVEILVTFNTGSSYNNNGSPVTLPDLKKQRSDRRNSGRVTVSSSSSQQDLSNTPKARNGHCITATYTYDPPPSPSVSMQKYRSDPNEILGESTKQGCCTIM